MTRKKASTANQTAFIHQSDWPEEEAFPIRLFEEKLHDVARDLIEQIKPAWQAYRISHRDALRLKTPAEQKEAAADLGRRCIAMAGELRRLDLQHLDAAAWQIGNKNGIDIIDEKEAAAVALARLGACYTSAVTSGNTSVRTKRPLHSRDELARAVVAAVSAHCARKADMAPLVGAVLEAVGAPLPGDLSRYIRSLTI